jgi:hypothetical protein
VFYFFEKDRHYIQCEVRNTAVPDTFAIVVTEPDGRIRTHYVTGSNDVHRRWRELEVELAAAGWSGPHGRDS